MPLFGSKIRWMMPAAVTVIAASSLVQAQQPYNANEVIDLYNQQNGFGDAAGSYSPASSAGEPL